MDKSSDVVPCLQQGRALGRRRHEGETGRKRMCVCVCVYVCVCLRMPVYERVKQRQGPVGFDDGIGSCHDAHPVSR